MALKDAKNQVTTWTYNALDQILTKAYPNGDTHTYTYDSLHRMATHRTPKLETCTYTYDLRDRPLKSDWNTTTPDTTKTYFANGLLKSIDNGISKSDYAHSVRNELTAETQTLANQSAKVVSYSYDADGLRLVMGAPSARLVEYEWTAKGQLETVNADTQVNPPPPDLAKYTYDTVGRPKTTAHENGITEVKTYNAASELLSNAHSGGGLNPPSQHAYTYDSTGRRTAETRTGTLPATNTYGYDTADQVTSADYGNSLTDAYAYDPMGNRSTFTRSGANPSAVTYTANSANQYTSVSNLAPPIHDANGNLTSQGGVTYTWDSENRLLSTSDGTTTNTFTYDANHRRVTKRTAVNGTVTEKTHFIYDGWNVIEERNNTDTAPSFNLATFTLSKELTWGTDLSGSLQGAGGVGGLLLTTDHGSLITSHFYHYDGNGNVTQVTTNTGSTAATYRYDAFGNTLQATGTYAQSNKYRFSTKPIDAEITTAPLYYYGYRYYDPETGRWPSRDPIGEMGGYNLYGFLGNNGVNQWDYLGQKAVSWVIPIIDPWIRIKVGSMIIDADVDCNECSISGAQVQITGLNSGLNFSVFGTSLGLGMKATVISQDSSKEDCDDNENCQPCSDEEESQGNSGGCKRCRFSVTVRVQMVNGVPWGPGNTYTYDDTTASDNCPCEAQ